MVSDVNVCFIFLADLAISKTSKTTSNCNKQVFVSMIFKGIPFLVCVMQLYLLLFTLNESDSFIVQQTL